MNNDNKSPASIYKKGNTMLDVLSFTLDKVQQLADANSILGEKIVVGDSIIIPVSKVSAGFAGGGADLVDANKKKKQTPVGTGGNVTVTPITFLVIDKDGVKTVDINSKEEKNSPIGDIVTAIAQQIKSSQKSKNNSEQNK